MVVQEKCVTRLVLQVEHSVSAVMFHEVISQENLNFNNYVVFEQLRD